MELDIFFSPCKICARYGDSEQVFLHMLLIFPAVHH
jgi:hypothetical protein